MLLDNSHVESGQFSSISEFINICTSGKVSVFNEIITSNRPGSSVAIATDYGLDGPGSNLGGDEIFRLSRPALGPTQHPIKWVRGLSRG